MARIRSEYEKKVEAKRQKARREKRISNKQCIGCGKQDERTLSGFTRCDICREKRRARGQKYRASEYGKRMHLQRSRETNARLKGLGICIGCRKNDAEPGHAYCKACIEKYIERNRKYAAKKKKEKENGKQKN